MVVVGTVVDYPTVHDKKIKGKIELILENTVIVRDSEDGTHVVLKKTIEEDGFLVDEPTHQHKTRYTRK